MSLKNPVTTPGIDPGTVRLVAQRLNHYATPGLRSTCKVSVNSSRILTKFNFLGRLPKISKYIKFRENPSSGSPVIPCGQTEGRAVTYRDFSNAPKKLPHSQSYGTPYKHCIHYSILHHSPQNLIQTTISPARPVPSRRAPSRPAATRPGPSRPAPSRPSYPYIG